MIDRVMRTYDRVGEFASALVAIVSIALTTILFRFRRPDRFPLRCQHCTARIRLATAEHPSARLRGIAVYRDRDGHYACDGTIRMMHTPMPKIR